MPGDGRDPGPGPGEQLPPPVAPHDGGLEVWVEAGHEKSRGVQNWVDHYSTGVQNQLYQYMFVYRTRYYSTVQVYRIAYYSTLHGRVLVYRTGYQSTVQVYKTNYDSPGHPRPRELPSVWIQPAHAPEAPEHAFPAKARSHASLVAAQPDKPSPLQSSSSQTDLLVASHD